jgi:hypothetical protein
MTGTAILWPTIAMAALTFAVGFTLLFQRMGHIKRNPPRPEDFATGGAAMRYFEPVEMASNNLRNLFEMPVLFFALVPLLLVTGFAGPAQVALAWAYVALRALHSAIHIGRGPVRRRFLVHLLSTIALMAMWIGFAVRMIAII